MDETGFDRNISNDWGLAPAGLRTPRKLSAVTSFYITMVNCIAANGMLCAPFFIIPAKRRPRDSEHKLENGRLKGTRPSTGFRFLVSGFLTTELWEDAVTPFLCAQIKSIANEASERLWSLLVLDGLGSHVMSHKALKKFYDSRIIVMKMASHTSADLQPLDKTVFHPVKVGTQKSAFGTLGISPNIWKRFGMRELRRRQYVQAFNPVESIH
jgi:hypothetical protein